MGAKQDNYRHLAETLIKKFAARNIDAVYVENRDEARDKVLSMMPKGSSVGVGGSVTLDECGLIDALREENYDFIDRYAVGTPEEQREVDARNAVADFFLMSTNAFTRDGELVNIDGRGSRLAYFIYGPEKVIVVASMNKMATDVSAAIDRVQNVASPPNCVRLSCKTPCATTGVCGDCHGDTICCQIVITRHSRVPGRLTVILVGEELGF